MRLREIALPTVVAWEPPKLAPDQTERQIVWLKGTDSLTYSFRRPGNEWSTTPIDQPERFGFVGTYKSARAAARQFFGMDLA